MFLGFLGSSALSILELPGPDDAPNPFGHSALEAFVFKEPMKARARSETMRNDAKRCETMRTSMSGRLADVSGPGPLRPGPCPAGGGERLRSSPGDPAGRLDGLDGSQAPIV